MKDTTGRDLEYLWAASPVSLVLVGPYIEFCETDFMRRSLLSPALWLRYVDDVFVLWRDDEDFTSFFQQVNMLSES